MCVGWCDCPIKKCLGIEEHYLWTCTVTAWRWILMTEHIRLRTGLRIGSRTWDVLANIGPAAERQDTDLTTGHLKIIAYLLSKTISDILNDASKIILPFNYDA